MNQVTYTFQGQTLTDPMVERHQNHPDHGNGIVVQVTAVALQFKRWVPIGDVISQTDGE